MWIRNLAVLIPISLGIGLTPHQRSARTLGVERALQTVLSNYDVIRMEPSDIEERVKASNKLKVQLRSGLGLVDFRVEQRNLLSPRYRSEVTGEDGVQQQLPPPPVTTYRGSAVAGQEVVPARFTITSDRFEGVVFTPGDWHYIEPLRNYLPSAEVAELVVYKHSDIKRGQEWRCGVSRRLQEGRDRLAARAAATDTTTTYTVEVATEADYEYVRYWGGSASAANREILGILNQVEGVYETELNLKLEIVYQHAWTSSNDPYFGTDGDELIRQFREYWNVNFISQGYDLAHLWTGKQRLTKENEDGEEKEVAGQASLGTVCNPFYSAHGSYGFSKRLDIGFYNVFVTAHEIGHNFSAVHPNEEEPPVASCRNTIMQSDGTQYSTLTFCQFSRNEIRDHVSTYNSCLEANTETITVNPPSNLTAEAIGASQISLTWRDNSTNELTFTIVRRAPGKDWDVLVLLPPDRTVFVDAGLSSASTYSYQVFAVAEGSDGEPVYGESNIVTATTLYSDPGGGGGSPDLTRWVIPTMANSPGRHGAYYRTKVILWNFDSDLDLTMRLFGPNGFVARRNLSIDADIFWTWSNFLEQVFDYGGAGAVEFSGNAPFTVSAEVYTTSSEGKYTTVVHNGPAPLRPYSSVAGSVGVVTVNGATRTNAGVFNNSNRSQTVTARVHYTGSNDPAQTITFSLPPKGWAQKSVSARGERGHIIWRIPQEAYLWVVSVDNRSNDGTLAVPTPLP